MCFLCCLVFEQASQLLMKYYYGAADRQEGHPARGFWSRRLRGAEEWVDSTALALRWKGGVMDFDQSSPISSAHIVTATIAITTCLITKKILTALITK